MEGVRARDGILRVVVIDDYPSYAHGLKVLLDGIADDIDVVGMATSGVQGVSEVKERRPDVVVMDVRMPGVDGIEAARAIRGSLPDTKIVMLTASDDFEDVRSAMQLGVRAYLLKGVEVDELVAAIRMVHAGEVVISPQVVDALLTEPASGAADTLTDWERELMRMVAEGLDNAEIARRLSVSESTFKRNLHNVEVKLQARNRVHAAVIAAKTGLI